MAQGTQTGTLYQSRGMGWGGRGEGGSKGRRYMCTYGWFMLRFDRKQQSSVKQPFFNKEKKKDKFKKEKILSPLFVIPDSWLQTLASRLLMEWGHISWGMSLLHPPLYQLRIKVTFLFPPSSVSVFFIWLWWAEKAKILVSKNITYGWNLKIDTNEAVYKTEIDSQT